MRHNHTSAADIKDHVVPFMAKEGELGAMIGPFERLPFSPWCHLSPLMKRLKKNSLAKRIIMDLNFPLGAIVNAGIRKGYYQGTPFSFTLPTITTLSDRLGLSVEGSYYIDLALLSDALACARLMRVVVWLLWKKAFFALCYIDDLMRVVVWLLRKKGFFVSCYLDYFIGIEQSLEKAAEAYEEFLSLASQLGLALAVDSVFR